MMSRSTCAVAEAVRACRVTRGVGASGRSRRARPGERAHHDGYQGELRTEHSELAVLLRAHPSYQPRPDTCGPCPTLTGLNDDPHSCAPTLPAQRFPSSTARTCTHRDTMRLVDDEPAQLVIVRHALEALGEPAREERLGGDVQEARLRVARGEVAIDLVCGAERMQRS